MILSLPLRPPKNKLFGSRNIFQMKELKKSSETDMRSTCQRHMIRHFWINSEKKIGMQCWDVTGTKQLILGHTVVISLLD